MSARKQEAEALLFAYGYLAGQPLSRTQNEEHAEHMHRWSAKSLAQIFEQIEPRPNSVNELAEWMGNMVAAERAGEVDAASLTRFAGELLSRGKELPEPLRLWLADMLMIPRPPVSGKPGRTSLHGRDAAIMRALNWIVVTHGLQPTRNPSHWECLEFPQSACSIVAHALGALRAAISESAVEKIWNKRRKD